MVAFRNLASESGPDSARSRCRRSPPNIEITDGPDENGEMFQRPGRPSDHFPSPFANEQAARASNSGAYPPDLSLIAKARGVTRGFPTFLFDFFTQYQEIGPDYIYALLTGYQEPPAGRRGAGRAVLQPLFHLRRRRSPCRRRSPTGRSTYAQNADETDGNDVPETVDQYAKDVSAFLMWAAEPHLVERKRWG